MEWTKQKLAELCVELQKKAMAGEESDAVSGGIGIDKFTYMERGGGCVHTIDQRILQRSTDSHLNKPIAKTK